MNENKWIKGAIKHPGRCTPMSKPGCTGHARALAKRFKKGGDLHGESSETTGQQLAKHLLEDEK